MNNDGMTRAQKMAKEYGKKLAELNPPGPVKRVAIQDLKSLEDKRKELVRKLRDFR